MKRTYNWFRKTPLLERLLIILGVVLVTTHYTVIATVVIQTGKENADHNFWIGVAIMWSFVCCALYILGGCIANKFDRQNKNKENPKAVTIIP